MPREILEHVTDADISPDGKDLLVVREVGRLQRLEFPVGNLVVETDGWISQPRISPDGSQLAFLEHTAYGNDGGFVLWRLLKDSFLRVEAQPGLALVAIRSVAREAVVGQDWPHVAIEANVRIRGETNIAAQRRGNDACGSERPLTPSERSFVTNRIHEFQSIC